MISRDELKRRLGIDAEEERKQFLTLPRVVAAKKIRFLKAIKANDQLDISSDVSIEDANLPINLVFGGGWPSCLKTRSANLFDDSIVITHYMNIKRPEFDLKTYTWCVKELCCSPLLNGHTLCYLFANARDFAKPQNNLFELSEDGDHAIQVLTGNTLANTSSQKSPFIVKVMALIEDLMVKYDELKYQQLNLNVTYLVLFMTRKLFKSESTFENALKKPKTHEDYYRLCPRPLSTRLPDDEPLLKSRISPDKKLMALILYAYHKSARLTRRVLLTTCIAHMEYTGLGLPMMFDRIVQLYQVSETRLWDALCIKDTYESMFALADFHHSQYEGEQLTPPKSYTLFPYCRVFSQYYHANISCSDLKNLIVCYAMAYLIDKKLGFDKSHIRNSTWAKANFPVHKQKGAALAASAYEKITNNNAM